MSCVSSLTAATEIFFHSRDFLPIGHNLFPHLTVLDARLLHIYSCAFRDTRIRASVREHLIALQITKAITSSLQKKVL